MPFLPLALPTTLPDPVQATIESCLEPLLRMCIGCLGPWSPNPAHTAHLASSSCRSRLLCLQRWRDCRRRSSSSPNTAMGAATGSGSASPATSRGTHAPQTAHRRTRRPACSTRLSVTPSSIVLVSARTPPSASVKLFQDPSTLRTAWRRWSALRTQAPASLLSATHTSCDSIPSIGAFENSSSDGHRTRPKLPMRWVAWRDPTPPPFPGT